MASDAAATGLDLLIQQAGLPVGRAASYLGSDGELDPSGATELLRAQGWSLFLPVVADGHPMLFGEWSVATHLRRNQFDMLEPGPDVPRVGAAELDLILVPCVAVDLNGNRLGFGAGYYDRALAHRLARDSVERPLLIGLAYESQMIEALEPEPWDVALDAILTESRAVLVDSK